MKTIRFLFAAALLLVSSFLFSQVTNNLQAPTSVNTDGTAPNASAQLDVNATDKGMLVPRMTSAQRTAIASPANGLLVFDTNSGSFWFYSGGTWKNLSAVPKILADADNDTKIQVEESPDEDMIRFHVGGWAGLTLQRNAAGNFRLELDDQQANTFVGGTAGNSNTTGNNNAAFGLGALSSNTTGSTNTAIGSSTLILNSTGNNNTANGFWALLFNTTGSNNTASGVQALRFNSTGYSNVAVGMQALYSNTTRSNLVAVGDSALYNNGSGATLAEHATGNTAVGSKALFANTTGHSNTASGAGALISNTTGNTNTAHGISALPTNTTGNSNTASGWLGLFANTTGSGNTAVGSAALFSNTSGSNNTGIGYNAGVLTGNLNKATAIGYNAKVACSNCLVLGGTGADSVNVGIGNSNPQAKLDVNGDILLPTGNSLFVGGKTYQGNDGLRFHQISGSGYIDMKGTGSLYFRADNVLGGSTRMTITNNGMVGIGTTNPSEKLHVDGNICYTGTIGACSDIRFKKGFKPITGALGKIRQLNGLYYFWRREDFPDRDFTNERQIGLIAQEVEALFPEMVLTDDEGYKSVDYSRLAPVFVEAMKEQQAEIEELKLKNESLQSQLSEVDELKQRMARLEAALANPPQEQAGDED